MNAFRFRDAVEAAATLHCETLVMILNLWVVENAVYCIHYCSVRSTDPGGDLLQLLVYCCFFFSEG